MKLFTIDFSKISLKDLPIVGGKNSSLGEMFQNLSEKGIKVPDGFATTSEAYWHFLDSNNLRQQISEALSKLDTNEFSNLNFIGTQIRESILKANIPNEIQEAIKKSYINLIKKI
jgi:pyruvate,water dikinase